jgi:hypothetical protein
VGRQLEFRVGRRLRAIPALRIREGIRDHDRCPTIGPVHPRCFEHLGLTFSPVFASPLRFPQCCLRFIESRRFSRLERVGSAFGYHIPFQRITCFLSTFQVGTPASINASSNRFPASIKTAGGVQSPAGSGFHSVSATRPSRGETNCDTMGQASSAVILADEFPEIPGFSESETTMIKPSPTFAGGASQLLPTIRSVSTTAAVLTRCVRQWQPPSSGRPPRPIACPE